MCVHVMCVQCMCLVRDSHLPLEFSSSSAANVLDDYKAFKLDVVVVFFQASEEVLLKLDACRIARECGFFEKFRREGGPAWGIMWVSECWCVRVCGLSLLSLSQIDVVFFLPLSKN